MDWFERLTGFREGSYDDTRAKLGVEGRRLRSLVNGKSWAIGELELVSLRTLRERTRTAVGPSGRLRLSLVQGDVRQLHDAPEYAGALFQVASQFNALEMTGPEVTPEDGVTRYQRDPTQGPACAIAAGAATIYRNYFAPAAGGVGQTAERQFDGLANLGAALSKALGKPVADLWRMRNGYALCSRAGLEAIAKCLAGLNDEELDALRSELSIVIHSGVEVTDGGHRSRPAGLSGVLLCVAGRLYERALTALAGVRDARPGGGLRGDDAGGDRELEPGRLQHRAADAARRRRLRQRRGMDPRRHAARADHGIGLRPRCEDRELPDAITGPDQVGREHRSRKNPSGCASPVRRGETPAEVQCAFLLLRPHGQSIPSRRRRMSRFRRLSRSDTTPRLAA